MADKNPKFDKLWVVEGNSGRYVKVVKQGREWLYLEPKYVWDKPRVSLSEVAVRGANVSAWSDRMPVRAYMSDEHWKSVVRRDALVRAFRSAFELWAQTDQYTLDGLETAAKALGIEVKDD